MSEEKFVPTRWTDIQFSTGIQPQTPNKSEAESSYLAKMNREQILSLPKDHPKRIELVAQMAQEGLI